MTHFASIDGVRAVSARVTIPFWGAWHADVMLDREADVGATCTLRLAELELACAPWRPAVKWQGRTTVRLIGGAGKWRDVIPAASYFVPAGVKLSLVLGDAAKAAGERLELRGTYAKRSVGTHHIRAEAPASCALNRWAPRAWWIEPSGLTVVGDRATSTIGSPFTIELVDGARGVVVVATEKPADFVPGRTFKGASLSSTITVNGVTHILSGDKLRTEILT